MPVHSCDHCNKKLFREHAMKAHELKCSKNPLNIRACFDCSFCKKVGIEYEPEVQTYEDDTLPKSSCFKCTAKNIFMCPPKVEHGKGLPDVVWYGDEEISQESMPLKCDDYKEQTVDEFFNKSKTE